MPSTATSSDTKAGVIYALLAYGSWGLMAVYWKWVAWVPSLEMIAHRVIWTLLLIVPLVLGMQQGRALAAVFRKPRLLAVLALTAALVSVNWLGFVWAVSHDQVVQASLGYFINPLFSVLLGVLCLHERLRLAQWLAVGLAICGVAWMALRLGQVPWISLMLASSFALYGLFRKFTPVSATVGLTVESLLVVPVAIAYLLWLGCNDQGLAVGQHGWAGWALVAASGLTTAVPLLWFANAAQRLPLSTLGFVQYLAPSLQLALGVFVYHEPFTQQHLVAFGLIWLGLLVFSIDSIRAQWRLRQASLASHANGQ
ncbi:EamA family transporter RarD [Lampropedia puyangensis]|uniref:EamA family transporter RarD n=1 Tax=Lampropedia puyangensis TaxID=1330072 RepID=A0A4S8FD07_9BURK|nr:EamA family transporter RarD [Lampropedia puyangensis]THU05473.1 EamA family transporter RarD [Lampropedia puyangensis]